MSKKNDYANGAKIITMKPFDNLNLPDNFSPFNPENPLRRRWEQMREKNDFDPAPVDPERLANVRFGMITNLNSGGGHGKKYSRILYENIIAHQGIVRESSSLKNLPEIIHEFKEEGVNAIIVNGGDGTMAATATEVFHTWEGEMPAFVPLRGGTMNATAKALNIPRSPSAVLLDRLIRVINSKQGGLVEHWLGTLRMKDPRRHNDQYGFIYATGLAFEFSRYTLSLGDSSDKNTIIAMSMLSLHGLLGTRLGKEVWRDIPAEVTIDGKEVELDRMKILVIATVLNFPLFIKPFPSIPSAKTGKFGYMINGMRKRDIFKQPLSLLRGKYEGKNHLTGHASEIKVKLDGGYMMDGELWSHSRDIEIKISFGIPLKVWWFEQPSGFFW